MTILQFTLPNHPSLGGIFNVHQDFRRILNAPIVEIVPRSMRGITDGDYQIQIIGFGFLDKYGIPLNAANVLRSLDNLEIKLIIIHGLFHSHAIIAYQFARQRKIPYLFVPHGTLDPYVFSYRVAQKRLWMQLLGQRLIDQASGVICTTDREKQKAAPFLKQTRVAVCPWGVKMPPLEVNEWRYRIRTLLGIPFDAKVLICIGRLNRMKRFYETALAFKQLCLPAWRLLIVGYVEEQSVFDKIQQLCDRSTIYYHPPIEPDKRWQFLAAADAYVSLGYRENFGYSIVEAALTGLPLLLSDGADIYPLFETAGAAQVVTVKSQAELMAGLALFLNKPPEQLKEMGQRAAQVAQQNFNDTLFSARLKAIVAQHIGN